MPEWTITANIDDAVAITIGRTVVADGDAASDEVCRMAFGAALPQFMARAVAARYAAALDARAAAHANDLATAVVADYPDGYDPQLAPVELREPPGPGLEFRTGPAADPSSVPVVGPIVSAALGGEGTLDGAPT